MPRLRPSLLRLASHESSDLLQLLRECRDLPSCRNELRWLTEHALTTAQALKPSGHVPDSGHIDLLESKKLPGSSERVYPDRTRPMVGWRSLLRGYVRRRAKGEPLQYILGSQPFGELEILCRPGVLIPRSETEVYTTKLGHLIRQFLTWTRTVEEKGAETHKRTSPLRILDLCTGTGCILLSLYEMLARNPPQQRQMTKWQPPRMIEVLGVDISPTVLDLATQNLWHNINLGHLPAHAAADASFLRADVLAPFPSSSVATSKNDIAPVLSLLPALKAADKSEIEVLTANPPYISPHSTQLSRSVRRYEPRLALIPSAPTPLPPYWPAQISVTPGDEFYYHILSLAQTLNVGLTVLEVGDTEQAGRVTEIAQLALKRGRRRQEEGEGEESVLEVWFDDESVKRVPIQPPEHTLCENEQPLAERNEEDESHRKQEVQEKHQNLPSARAILLFRRDWASWRNSTERASPAAPGCRMTGSNLTL